jgi:hypothetical protein
MRVKVSIFVVIISLLWSSLESPSQNHFSKYDETKVAAHIVDTDFETDEDYIWKKSPAHDRLIHENSESRLVDPLCEQLKTLRSFTPIPVKFYLRFRVFRN